MKFQIDMDKQIRDIAEQNTREEINIATEIYLSRNCTSIFYNELMTDRKNLVTSRSLISWLDDRRYKRKQIDGLLTFYKRENPEHFLEGKWQPAYLPVLMLSIKDLATRKDIVSNRQKRGEFLRSFAREDWVYEASSIVGLKMLESLYKTNSLITNEAFMWIGQTIQMRNLLEAQARRTGRQMKNHDYYLEDVNHQIREQFQVMQRNFVKRLETSNTTEYRIYEKYRSLISNNISQIAKLVQREQPLLIT